MNQLKLYRVRAGHSLRTAASAMSPEFRVSAQSIGKYERGEMTPISTALLELARIYQTPPEELMREPDRPRLTLTWNHILYNRPDGSYYGKRITELPGKVAKEIAESLRNNKNG